MSSASPPDEQPRLHQAHQQQPLLKGSAFSTSRANLLKNQHHNSTSQHFKTTMTTKNQSFSNAAHHTTAPGAATTTATATAATTAVHPSTPARPESSSATFASNNSNNTATSNSSTSPHATTPNVQHVLPFYHSYAYTVSGHRATPLSSVPESLKSFYHTAKMTGGTEYLDYHATSECSTVDSHVMNELSPLFESMRQRHHRDQLYFDQSTVLSNLIQLAFDTPIERVRAIFQWMCTHIRFDERSLNPIQNIQLNILNRVEPYYEIIDPDEVMESRTSASEGYANLFVLLCKKLDIQAVKIKGYAKGFSSSFGTKIDQYNHAWNAVHLDSHWYLIDICWSRGYVEFGHFKNSFTDAYFMSDPRGFVMDHFPINDKWMLFEPKLTKEEFERLCKTSVTTLHLGAYPVMQEHVNSVIITDKSYLLMPFHTRKPVQVYVRVTPLISTDNADARKFVFGRNFQHVQHYVDGGFRVFLLFPFAGTYNVLIFASERDADASSLSSSLHDVITGEEPHNGTGTATGHKHFNLHTITTGSDSAARDGTKTIHDMIFEYVVETNDNLVYNVGFAEQTHILTRQGGRLESPMQEYLKHSDTYHFRIRTPSYAMVMVKLGDKVGTYLSSQPNDPELFLGDVAIEPAPIEYIEGMFVSVHGFDDRESAWVPLVIYRVYTLLPELKPLKLSFLRIKSLFAKKKTVDVMIPEYAQRVKQLALEELFHVFSPVVMIQKSGVVIEPLSHQHIFISSSSGSYTISVQCKHRNIRFKPLPLERYGRPLRHQTTWMVCPKASLYYFRVECPIPGQYVFKVQATVREPNQKEKRCIALRYIIDSSSWNMKTIQSLDVERTRNKRRLICYPKTFPSYSDLGCVLLSPMEALVTQQSYTFRIYVPNAEHVGVMCNGVWYPLVRLHSENADTLYLNHTFEGRITVPSTESDHASSSSSSVSSSLSSQRSLGVDPSVYICTSDMPPLVRRGQAQEQQHRSQPQQQQQEPQQSRNVNVLCRFTVYRSGNVFEMDPVLSAYDEKTMVDPSKEMLRYIRFVSHKRKMIRIVEPRQTTGPHQLSIQFKQIKYDNKYIDQDRYRISTVQHAPFSDVERETMIRSLPGQYEQALTSEHDLSAYDDTVSESPIILLKAALFDEVREIEGSVLVQQDSINIFDASTAVMAANYVNFDRGGDITGYFQLKVHVPKPGRYLLRINIVVIDELAGSREEHDGVIYWIHYNEYYWARSNQPYAATSAAAAAMSTVLASETEHDTDLSLSHFLFGRDRYTKCEKYFFMQRELHGNNGQDGQPVHVPFRKQQALQAMYEAQESGSTGGTGFVLLSPENYEWFRPMVYEPCARTLHLGRLYRIKVKVFNTDSVMLCSSMRRGAKRQLGRTMTRTNLRLAAERLAPRIRRFRFYWETPEEEEARNQLEYMEWQQLDNSSAKIEWDADDETIPESRNVKSESRFDTIHGDEIWEGIVSFTRGTEVHVMARYGMEHYVSVATWLLREEPRGSGGDRAADGDTGDGEDDDGDDGDDDDDSDDADGEIQEDDGDDDDGDSRSYSMPLSRASSFVE